MKRLFVFFTLTAILTALLTQPATAAPDGIDFIVSSKSDAPDANPGDGFCGDGNGDCGLRAAVMEANALAGAQEIFVPGLGQYNIGSQIPVTDSVVIRGGSSATTRLDGGDQARLFDVTSTSLTLEAMTLQNANGGVTNGGAIRTNNPPLGADTNNIVLRDMVVKNNTANNGGGLFVLGNLTIQNSIIENNTATFDGGGITASLSNRTTIIGNSIIRNNTAGSDAGGLTATGLIMSNSAVHNNSAGGSAGGIRLGSGTHSLVQVTVSSNSADSGGGIYLSGTSSPNLSGVTITNNEALASRGGGIRNVGIGTVTVQNSIIAGNFGGHPDCYGGTWASQGYNLIGLITAECSWAGDTDNDQFNTTLPALDPDLGTLQLNDHDSDGTLDETPTHVPNDGSLAVNGGNPDGCRAIGSSLPFPFSSDQRGAERHQQGRCDVGSAESPHEPATPPTAVAVSKQLAVNSEQWQGVAMLLFILVFLTTRQIWMRGFVNDLR